MIIFQDNGDPQKLNSTTDLIINVLDVQDTPPSFINLPYMADVYENATIVSIISGSTLIIITIIIIIIIIMQNLYSTLHNL